MDRSRQWAQKLEDVSPNHIARYAFACGATSGRVLDAACGVGYGTRMLQDAGREAFGLDHSKKALLWAERWFSGPNWLLEDLNDFAGYAAFDWIVSFETIEHLQRPEPVLQRFHEAAGLIVSVPNQEHYPFEASRFANDEYPHYRHYRPAELEAHLENSGFRVVGRHCQRGKKPEIHAGTDGTFLIYVAKSC